MFRIEEQPFGSLRKFVLKNSNTKEYVSIIPEFGGVVHEIVLRAGTLHSLLESEKTARSLIANKWYRGAKLLPFPNRIKNGRYLNEQLPLNFSEHAIHGLLYNKGMSVKRKNCTAKKAELALSHRMEGLRGYPYALEIIVTYRLDAKGFSCETTAKNIGKKTAPFGDGWHPYFQIGKKALLKLPSSKRLLLKQMIPTEKIVLDKRFTQPARVPKLDDCFVGTGTTEVHTNGIIISIWQDSSYKYVQVFTPPRKSVAVEPMSCAPDAFNNRLGLVMLKPGQHWRGNYGVQLNRI